MAGGTGCRLTTSLFSAEAGWVLLPFGGLEEVSGGTSLLAGSWDSCLQTPPVPLPPRKRKCHGHGVGWWPSPSWVLLSLTLCVALSWAESIPSCGHPAAAGRVPVPWHRPLSKGWTEPDLWRGHRALGSPCVCAPAHFLQQEFVRGWDRREEESWLLRAELLRPLVPLLLPRSRGNC